MDCEKLSPNALKIFEKIKVYYPPDSWKNSQWKEEGTVYDNGWHDLRKSENRNKLIERYTSAIGRSILLTAKMSREQNKELRGCDINLKMCERWIDLVVLLEDLDFQIETIDLVEM